MSVIKIKTFHSNVQVAMKGKTSQPYKEILGGLWQSQQPGRHLMSEGGAQPDWAPASIFPGITPASEML